MSVQELNKISESDLEAMMSKELLCDMCNGPAELMSRGHRCRPPGFRVFKCTSCYTAWAAAAEIRIMTEANCSHGRCGMIITSVEDLSAYHPV